MAVRRIKAGLIISDVPLAADDVLAPVPDVYYDMQIATQVSIACDKFEAANKVIKRVEAECWSRARDRIVY